MSSESISLVPDCLRCAGRHTIEMFEFNDGAVVEVVDSGTRAKHCPGWGDALAGIQREVRAYNTYRKGFSTVERALPTQEQMRRACERNGLLLDVDWEG